MSSSAKHLGPQTPQPLCGSSQPLRLYESAPLNQERLDGAPRIGEYLSLLQYGEGLVMLRPSRNISEILRCTQNDGCQAVFGCENERITANPWLPLWGSEQSD